MIRVFQTYILTFVLLLSSSVNSYAQQVPLVDHTFINPSIINPALVGATGQARAFLIRNDRFAGFGNGLSSNYLTIDGFFDKWNSGIGLELSQQSFGIQKQVGLNLAYAYRLKLKENNFLSLGVKAGILDNQIDAKNIFVVNSTDPYLDGLIAEKMIFNASFGANATLGNLNVGFGIPQLVGNKVAFSPDDSRGYYQLERHYTLNASYLYKFSDTKISLKPDAIARYAVGNAFQFDAGLLFDYDGIGYFRAGYKSGYAVEFGAGIHLMNSLYVGYNYELPIARGNENLSGFNHEFLVGISFDGNKESKNKIIESIIEVPLKDSVLMANFEAEKIKNAENSKSIQELLEENLKQKLRMDSLELALKQSQEAEPEVVIVEKRVEVEVKSDVETIPVENNEPETIKIPELTAEQKANIKPSNLEDYFVELSGEDSPVGTYIVIGAYSDIKRAQNVVKDAKKDYQDSRIIFNFRNSLNYVIVKYAVDMYKTMGEVGNSRKLGYERAWVLDYKKPKRQPSDD